MLRQQVKTTASGNAACASNRSTGAAAEETTPHQGTTRTTTTIGADGPGSARRPAGDGLRPAIFGLLAPCRH
jgi:hypothetical protein